MINSGIFLQLGGVIFGWIGLWDGACQLDLCQLIFKKSLFPFYFFFANNTVLIFSWVPRVLH